MPVAIKNRRNIGLRNYMEELTGTVLEDLLSEDYRGTRFPAGALQDIKALALNRLWPMYLTTDEGKQFIKKIVIEDKVEKDVVRELRAAIEIVKTHPRP